MRFHVELGFDVELNEPTRVLVSDDNEAVGTFRAPLRLNLYEATDLHDALAPFARAYKEHSAASERYCYGEVNERPDFLAILKRILQEAREQEKEGTAD